MKASRRDFAKAVTGILVASALSPMLAGCDTGTIASAIIASFSKVLGLLKAAGISVNNTLVEAIQAALAAFSAAYDAYEQNKSAGNLAALEAAAQAALNAVQTFLSQTNIGGPIAQVAVALLEIILSTLAGFLPAPKTFRLKVSSKEVDIAPKKRTVRQFKHDFNQACKVNGHPELELN